MTDPPSPEPLFIACDPGPVFATLHRPAEGRGTTAVLFCPPFGWDEVCSYRSLRFWATRLAAAGYPALRVTLPGTGDSAGHPCDVGLTGAWVAAITATSAWLRDHAAAQRVVGVGIGIGGLIVSLAAAEGAAIDDLALWATPARGRAIVRQLSAFARLERSQIYDGVSDPPPPTDGLETGGFLMTEETLAEIAAIDLRTLTLPAAAERHALLLDRDGLGVDRELREHLAAQGVTLTGGPGDGFADMTSHPQTARPPVEVIGRFGSWVAGLPAQPLSTRGTRRSRASPAARSCDLPTGGAGLLVRETVISIPQPLGQLMGVLSQPREPLGASYAVILLNAGAIRRIGPNRMWVEAARRWAAEGVPTLRLDAEALGDSDGDEAPYRSHAALYTPHFVPQVIDAMDFLQRQGVARRFVLGGLCSGASWALQAALLDSRVSGLLLLNPRVLVWSDDLGPARDLRALLSERPSISRIRRLARGPRLHAFLRWAATWPIRRLGRSSAMSDFEMRKRQLLADTERLPESGTRLLWLFSEHEPLHDELSQTGFLPRVAQISSVTVERIHVRDHTIRPSWAQQEVHRMLDRAVLQPAAPSGPLTESWTRTAGG
jgi:dienelactone hydrolase